MKCQNCGKESKSKFCSKKCSNIYNNAKNSKVLKILGNPPVLNESNLKELYKIQPKKILEQLLKNGLNEIALEYKAFKESHKLCPNCNNFYEGSIKSQKGCPNCKDFFDAKKSEISKKVKLTKLKKYNDENYCNSGKIKTSLSKAFNERKDEIISKRKKTLKEKTGYEHPLQNPQSQESFKQTCLSKFGVENPMQNSQVKDSHTALFTPEKLKKIHQMYYEKTGYKSPFENPEVIDKCQKTYYEKTGYKTPFANPDIKSNIWENYEGKTGFKYPMQNPVVREKSIQSYQNKTGFKHPTQNPETRNKIIKRLDGKWISQIQIQNYDKYYDKDFWLTNFKRPDEVMAFFGISYTTALIRLYDYNILSKGDKSKTQISIFNQIQTQNKIMNTRKILDGKELDIYLPDIKLGIEFNGLMFHSQGISDVSMFNTPDFDKDYHLKKTMLCAAKGIQLFHIFEGEPLDLWLSMIHNKLGLNTKVFARKCEIRELKNSDTKEFQNSNHIQGFCYAKICLGLYFENNLISIMTFAKPRFNSKFEYELIRFCSLKGYSIVGGASKLWKYFLKKYNPKSVISYANLRFSNGSIYEKLGFTKIGQSNPNYFYFKDSNILESRNKFQKHKLEKLHYNGILQCFDPTKSESENMLNNGYRRIFDCGNLVYVYQNIS